MWKLRVWNLGGSCLQGGRARGNDEIAVVDEGPGGEVASSRQDVELEACEDIDAMAIR